MAAQVVERFCAFGGIESGTADRGARTASLRVRFAAHSALHWNWFSSFDSNARFEELGKLHGAFKHALPGLSNNRRHAEASFAKVVILSSRS